MSALCIGQSALFDSTDPRDHDVARRLCRACDLLTACRTDLAQVQRDHAGAGPSGGPRGTWAGVLVASAAELRKVRSDANRADLAARQDDRLSEREQRQAEEADFDQRTLMAAEVAYSTGERSTWARVGYRIYERGRARARRAQKRAAA